MIRLITLLLAIVWGASVHAQSLPDRYMVNGVLADDVLNIRAERHATSEKIDEFPHDAMNVEILHVIDGWGQTATSEGFGWVSMRYLTANPWDDGQVPRPLICSGTEPFWNFVMLPSGAEYNDLSLNENTPRVQTVISEETAASGFLIQTQEGPTLTRTFAIAGRSCSDGMSDRPFGMSVTMFTSAPDGNYVQTGCCTIQP